MLGHEFQFRNKIPVALLGATGSVGQKFIELLSDHPWFQLTHLISSERSFGKKIRSLTVEAPNPNIECSVVFSALSASVAGEIERDYVNQGHTVISCSKNHRWDEAVPLVVPEVNGALAKKGLITSPNCVVTGIVLALKPLHDAFGLKALEITTAQSLSGAGFSRQSLDIENNLIPHIPEEEKKIETEPLKIFQTSSINISAQVMRVPIEEGHTISMSMKFKKKPSRKEIINLWNTFRSEPQGLKLFSAPSQPIIFDESELFPQPKKNIHSEKGMAISVGQLKESSGMDWRCVLLVHNTVRGGAGNAILIAEQMLKMGEIYW